MDVDDSTKVKIWQDMYKRTAWELKQLEQLGYELGEKIEPGYFHEVTKKIDYDEWWKNYIRSRMSQDDVPDNNAGKTEFKPGDKFILELGQERKMFDEFEIVGTDLYVKTSLLEKLTRYEPEEKATTDKIMIDLAEAIKTVKFECGEFEGLAQRIVNGLENLSPKQSEKIPYKKPKIICDPDCEGFVCHKNGIYGWCPKAERWGCDYFYELERRNDG